MTSLDETPMALEVPATLRSIVDGHLDAAVVLDAARRPRYWNSAYQQYTGLRVRELARRAEAPEACCHTFFKLEVCETMCVGRRAMDLTRAVRMDEIRARRADGEDLILIVTATPVDGFVLETYRDVTADARIQEKYKAMLARERDAKGELERKVAERTEALARANGELKRTQAQLIHQEKMSSLGRLVAGIAHELNNPINFVYGNVEFVSKYVKDLLALVDLYERASLDEPLRHEVDAKRTAIEFDFLRQDAPKLLRSVRAGAERTAAIVRDLKAFSRVGGGDRQQTRLDEGLETTLNLIAPILRDRIEVERDYGADVPTVACNAGHINQVFMNLLTNAAQAMRGRGRIRIQVVRAGVDRVQVRISDSGPGVPPEIRTQIFDPFFTTKEVGEGTGLGLTISESIVRNHGGRLWVEDADGGGARFVIDLPVHGGVPRAPEAERPS